MQASDDPEDGAETLAAARLADFLSGDASVLAALSLVYLNCCWGGTAARGGSPFEIAPLVPALISNRTSALVSGGRQQAVDILTSITGRGAAPHEAVALIANDARSL